MIKSLSSLVLSLTCLSASVSFAQGDVSPTELSQVNIERYQYYLNGLRNDSSYKETIGICDAPSVRSRMEKMLSPSGQFRMVLNGATQVVSLSAFDGQAFIDLVKYKGLDPHLGQLLESDAFHLALEECFPNEPRSQDAYVLSLVLADSGGKILGGAASYFFWLRLIKVYRILHGFPGLYKALQFSGVALGAKQFVTPFYELYLKHRVEKSKGPSQAYNQANEDVKNATSQSDQLAWAYLEQKTAETELKLQDPNLSIEEKKKLEDELERLRVHRLDMELARSGK